MPHLCAIQMNREISVMKSPDILKKNRQFTVVFRRGKVATSKTVHVIFMKNRLVRNRFGYTTSRSVSQAVKRNRLKRLMREALRHQKSLLKQGYDLVLITKLCGGQLPSYKQVVDDLNICLKKAQLLLPNADTIQPKDCDSNGRLCQ